ncbi:hypothetical protein, partial [Prochlorococcus sp. ALOHA_ZT_50]|uniref:hypothetical protein n=1 Tax=Prochlorococcus sp. ALOHA_ZT_50 TaxID=2919303 RepID=UPI002580AA81
MIEFKRSKKSRSKNALFNPYKNGISTYDLAYLSSKKIFKNLETVSINNLSHFYGKNENKKQVLNDVN